MSSSVQPITVAGLLGRMIPAARRVSAELDKFSVWMLAGFGAALTFLVGNFSIAEESIGVGGLRIAVILFLAAAVFCVLQKYISVLIGSMAAGFEETVSVSSDAPLADDFLLRIFMKSLRSVFGGH